MEKPIKPLKIPKIFLCECCVFNCINKKDFTKHLLTDKHNKNVIQINDNEKNPKTKITFNCVNCDKKFNDNAGLWRHKKKCNIVEPVSDTDKPNNEIINLLIENNKQLQDENREFKNIIIQLLTENKEQTAAILELTKISQEQNAAILELTKNGINSNNTTNNNNTKNFNIQIYLNETCKDAINIEDFIKDISVSNEDLLTYAEYDFGKATTDLIVKNLKPLKNNNFPFHCSNVQDKTIYTKSLNTWLKDEGELFQKMVINGIQRKLLVQFLSYRDEYPECKKSSSHLSNKYNKFTVSINSNYDQMFNNKILLNVIKNIVIPK
jgi:hypothetical protein